MRCSRQGPSLLVRAPGKLNLFLEVLGRRQDGFHELETLMISVRLYDLLRFTPASAGCLELECSSLSRSTATIPAGEQNLVMRAARLLQTECAPRQGVRIWLDKRIPAEAGMGGGSSDAAATLVALNLLWNLGLDSAALHALAARLGSDVNFFLDSAPAAVCTGRGEQIAPIPLGGRFHFVVVKPPSGLSTKRVFQAWSDNPDRPACGIQDAAQAASRGGSRQLSRVLYNSLEVSARRLNDDVAWWLNRLRDMDVWGSGMTGSGSACYAMCRSARQARILAQRCRGWQRGQVFAVSSGV